MNILQRKDLKNHTSHYSLWQNNSAVRCINLSQQTIQYQFHPTFPNRILTIQKHSKNKCIWTL